MRAFLVLVAVLALAACAGGSSPQRDRTDRLLARGSGQAQPSSIVAAELAFSRATVSDGYAKAYDRYGSDDALSFDLRGEHSIKALLKQQDFGGLIKESKPQEIVMSCDGSVAVSSGRYVPVAGKSGRYYRVWVRQSNRSYRMELEFVTPDGQPVETPEMIKTDVAKCRDSDAGDRLTKFAPLVAEMDRDAAKLGVKMKHGMSADNSLGWFAGHASQNDRGLLVSVFRDGAWHGALGDVTEADLDPLPVPVRPGS